MEDQLTDALEDIQEHLPSLFVYKQIYKNAVLSIKIAAVYKALFTSQEKQQDTTQLTTDIVRP